MMKMLTTLMAAVMLAAAAPAKLPATNFGELRLGDANFTDKTVLFYNGAISSYDVTIIKGRAYVPEEWFGGQRQPGAVHKDGGKLVPLREEAEKRGMTVEYYDGTARQYDYDGWLNAKGTRYIPRVKQIMVSYYPKDAKAMTADEAVALLKGEIEKANKIAEPQWRMDTSKLKVAYENDRYYVIPAVWDCFVDKYTEDVYVFYNGEVMQAHKFDPTDKNALVMAG